MSTLNKVMLVGNLTRDPELKYLNNNQAVCEFSIALNRKRKDKADEVTFVEITAWGKQAENHSKNLQKGSQVLIEGRLKFDQWEDKQTHKSRSKLSVVAENVQYLARPQSTGNPNSMNTQMPAYAPALQGQAPVQPSFQQGGYPPQAPVQQGAFTPQPAFSQTAPLPAAGNF